MSTGIIVLSLLGAIIIAGILLATSKSKTPSTNGSSDTEKPIVDDNSGLKK